VPDPATAVLTWLMSPGIGEQPPSLDEVLPRPTWVELAACAGMPIEVFFPSHGHTAAAARAVCSTCTVRPQCLDYASTDNDTAGVWGGTTERERRRPLESFRVLWSKMNPARTLNVLVRAVQRQWDVHETP
jgi:WhiB family transcriptional regulator, redox-sensing transcriptional regulator